MWLPVAMMGVCACLPTHVWWKTLLAGGRCHALPQVVAAFVIELIVKYDKMAATMLG